MAGELNCQDLSIASADAGAMVTISSPAKRRSETMPLPSSFIKPLPKPRIYLPMQDLGLRYVSSMVIAIHSREEVSQRTVSASAESGITFRSRALKMAAYFVST
jgi:hypothetical protein